VIETDPAPSYRPLDDSSLYGILGGNALTFVAATTQHWSAAPLLWVYWGQSVVIGIANVVRILRLQEFSTDGFLLNGRSVQPTRAVQVQTARFFAFHYGAFHLVYAVFLLAGKAGARLPAAELPWVVASILGFAFAHGYSLLLNHGRDFRQKKPNIGTLMFYPYLRIIPMHLAIILGSAVAGTILPVFIGLKTFADAGLHMMERWLFQRSD